MWGFVVAGNTTIHSTLKCLEAKAAASPAFPPELASTKMFFRAIPRFAARAIDLPTKLPIPLNLKLPDGCSYSFLKNTRQGGAMGMRLVTSVSEVLTNGCETWGEQLISSISPVADIERHI